MPCHVYMLSSRPYGTLYLGVTSNLGRRIVEHKTSLRPGFAATYGIDRLVWMEEYDSIVEAIAREKMLKKWKRDWKIALIETMNPRWDDLFDSLNHLRHSGRSVAEIRNRCTPATEGCAARFRVLASRAPE